MAHRTSTVASRKKSTLLGPSEAEESPLAGHRPSREGQGPVGCLWTGSVCLPPRGEAHKVTGGRGHFPLSPVLWRSSGAGFKVFGAGTLHGWVRGGCSSDPAQFPGEACFLHRDPGAASRRGPLLSEMEWRWRQVDGGGHPRGRASLERSDGPVSTASQTHPQ